MSHSLFHLAMETYACIKLQIVVHASLGERFISSHLCLFLCARITEFMHCSCIICWKYVHNNEFYLLLFQPLPETVSLVEDIVVEYVTDLVSFFDLVISVIGLVRCHGIVGNISVSASIL